MPIQPNQPEFENLRRLMEMAKAEDFAGGDVTSAILAADITCRGRFVAREPLVFCGGAFLTQIAADYDKAIQTKVSVAEGVRAEAGTVLANWSGPTRVILSAERVALNFLQRLSGVATATREYVDAVAGTTAAIYDTRKTTPGWRVLEKYAVRAGGARNHRMGLYDAVMVKDNHLAAMGDDGLAGLADKLNDLRDSLGPDGFIEVEVDTLEQLADALKMDVDVVLLDNMPPEQLVRAVAMRNEAGLAGRIELEASGGITLKNVHAVARTGVERIAIGALTHSARAVDIALEIETT